MSDERPTDAQSPGAAPADGSASGRPTTDGGRVEVCAAADLEPGDRELVEVEGHAIGVLNVGGEYYALANRCAHQGGPVCTGKVQGSLEGEFLGPGVRVREYFSEDTMAIACPWHGWEYDLETGIHLGDSEFRIPTYEVRVEDGIVYVEL